MTKQEEREALKRAMANFGGRVERQPDEVVLAKENRTRYHFEDKQTFQEANNSQVRSVRAKRFDREDRRRELTGEPKHDAVKRMAISRRVSKTKFLKKTKTFNAAQRKERATNI